MIYDLRATIVKAAMFGLFSALTLRPSSLLAQGSLNPPGAPASTMKSLDQIEPRTPISSLPFSINSSGAFYLTTNFVGTAGYISVNADNVLLDLNGFTMDGLSTSSFAVVVFSGKNITIRNGTLRGFSMAGTVVDGRNTACHFENVQMLENAGVGLWCGPASTFFNCFFASNTDQAITASGGAVVKNCTFIENGIPVQVGAGSLVADCIIATNSGSVQLGTGCTIKNCVLAGNDSIPIAGGDGTTVLDCIVRSNVFYGINVGSGCKIKNCVVEKNGQVGINCGNNSMIEDCLVVSNALDGIHTGGACIITGNSAFANGVGSSTVAGIHTTGSGSRIEANQSRGNGGYGIRSDGGAGADVIIRNSAGGNGVADYSPATGTTFGPIQNPSAMTNAMGNIVF